MAEHTIVVTNTAKKYLKGAADQTIRNRLWLSYLREQGRIKLGANGHDLNWNVKARQTTVRADGEHDAFEQLTIDVRGYFAGDRLTDKKKVMNRGDLAIVDLYGTKMDDLMKSLRDKFHAELYIDGNATGNEDRLLGIESFCGDDGATVAADIIANPSDTYAGKSTALANLGGNWSTGIGTSPNATAATSKWRCRPRSSFWPSSGSRRTPMPAARSSRSAGSPRSKPPPSGRGTT